MAVLLALVSSALWGTADFMGGTASRRLPVPAVVGWSQLAGLMTAAVLVVLAAFGVGGGSITAHDLAGATPWALAAASCGLIGLISFYAALAAGTMGVVAPIAATGVVVPVAVGLARGERPGTLQLVGLAVAVVGVIMASGPELRGRAGARPLVLAVVAAVGFGLSLTFLAEGSRSSTVLTALVMRGVAVVVFGMLALTRRSVGGVRRPDLPMLAAVGAFDVGANVLFGVASTRGLLSLVAVAGSLYPVATVILARYIHHERLGRLQYVGVVGALFGVVLIAGGGV